MSNLIIFNFQHSDQGLTPPQEDLRKIPALERTLKSPSMKCTLVCFIVLLIMSCSPLTKTQVKAVNSFAVVTKDFSAYPSKIMTELADIRMKRGIYYANSVETPKLHLEELDSIYSFHKGDYAILDKFDVTFKILDKYAQSLVLLTSDKYNSNLKEQAVRFGTDLDSLTTLYNAKDFGSKVPTSIGGAVSQLIAFGGSQYIRRRQAREVKKFVPQADKLVEVMTNNLLEFLESKNIATLIDNESRGISSNYLSYLRQSKTVSSAFTAKDTVMVSSNTKATVTDDMEYIKMRFAIDNVRDLRDETALATRALRKAHAKLLETIKERRKLKTAVSEIQELYEGVRGINKTILQIEKYKTPVDGLKD